jgi:hypothetical protein
MAKLSLPVCSTRPIHPQPTPVPRLSSLVSKQQAPADTPSWSRTPHPRGRTTEVGVVGAVVVASSAAWARRARDRHVDSVADTTSGAGLGAPGPHTHHAAHTPHRVQQNPTHPNTKRGDWLSTHTHHVQQNPTHPDTKQGGDWLSTHTYHAAHATAYLQVPRNNQVQHREGDTREQMRHGMLEDTKEATGAGAPTLGEVVSAMGRGKGPRQNMRAG